MGAGELGPCWLPIYNLFSATDLAACLHWLAVSRHASPAPTSCMSALPSPTHFQAGAELIRLVSSLVSHVQHRALATGSAAGRVATHKVDKLLQRRGGQRAAHAGAAGRQACRGGMEVAQHKGPRPAAHLQHRLGRLRRLRKVAQAQHGGRWHRSRRRRRSRSEAQGGAQVLQRLPCRPQHRRIGDVDQQDAGHPAAERSGQLKAGLLDARSLVAGCVNAMWSG